MTNREQIWVVLLSALVDIGGEGSKQTVLEYIQQNGCWYQNDSNRTNPPSRPTEYSWRNDISYGRQHIRRHADTSFSVRHQRIKQILGDLQIFFGCDLRLSREKNRIVH